MVDDVLPTKQFPDIRNTLLVLKHHGFRPTGCVDAGAFVGEWTRMWKHIFPRSTVLMIEPQEDKATSLKQLAAEFGGTVRFECAVLGPRSDESVTFYRMETGSSILPEISNYSRVATQRKTKTLDMIVAEHSLDQIDFIKLDTQGFELEILKGGAKTFGAASAVLVEASLLPYNRGAPLIAEVVRFFDQHGFQLCDICSDMRREDFVLRQTDLLFVRRESHLHKLLKLSVE